MTLIMTAELRTELIKDLTHEAKESEWEDYYLAHMLKQIAAVPDGKALELSDEFLAGEKESESDWTADEAVSFAADYYGIANLGGTA
jgi:hypothetical protein